MPGHNEIYTRLPPSKISTLPLQPILRRLKLFLHPLQSHLDRIFPFDPLQHDKRTTMSSFIPTSKQLIPLLRECDVDPVTAPLYHENDDTFMGLPAEVRAMIYGYVMEKAEQRTLQTGRGQPTWFNCEGRSLTMINRTIRQETLRLFWQDFELDVDGDSVEETPEIIWEYAREFVGTIRLSSRTLGVGFHWSDFASFRCLRMLVLDMRLCPSDWKRLGLNGSTIPHTRRLEVLGQNLQQKPELCFGLGERLQNISCCETGDSTFRRHRSSGTSKRILSQYHIVSFIHLVMTLG